MPALGKEAETPLAIIGSGWHTALFRDEITALVSAKSPTLSHRLEEVHPRCLVLDIPHRYNIETTSTHLKKKATLLDDILSPSLLIDLDGENDAMTALITGVSQWLDCDFSTPSSKVAVRAKRLEGRVGGLSTREIESKVGNLLSQRGFVISLTDPDWVLTVWQLGDTRGGEERLVVGISQMGESARQGWRERTAMRRPFVKPVSLDPRLARVMVNLLTLPDDKGKALCDPLCGTGGILMEAALLDLPAVGFDLDPEMVEGANKNIKWAIQMSNLTPNTTQLALHGDSTVLDFSTVDEWNIPVTAWAFDPPYGRNAWKSQEGFTLLLAIISSIKKHAKTHGRQRLAFLLPWPPLDESSQEVHENEEGLTFERDWVEMKAHLENEGFKADKKYLIPVHQSLSRLLMVGTVSY